MQKLPEPFDLVVIGSEKGGKTLSIDVAVIHLAMRPGVRYTVLRDERYTPPAFTEGLNGLFTSWVN